MITRCETKRSDFGEKKKKKKARIDDECLAATNLTAELPAQGKCPSEIVSTGSIEILSEKRLSLV